MSGIYDLAIQELKKRGVQDCEVYAPYFIISYACHGFHLMNKDAHAFTHGGLTLNARLPIIYMGPPGSGKSYLMEHLSNEKNGIFYGTSKTMVREQSLTEAGLVGSVKTGPDGQPIYYKGSAEENDEGFIVIDEFTDMMTAIRNKSGHSSQMEGQMLSALDSGKVRKRLASGTISYDTHFTLWCGIQPIKCDLSGGLGRRVCMLLNIPDPSTKRKYKDASRKANLIKIDMAELNKLRERISMWTSTFTMIKHVEFTEEFLDFVDYTLDTEQFIMEFYKRIGLGYHLAKFGVTGETITVELNDEIKDIITRCNDWRNRVIEGPNIFQISELIQSNGVEFESGWILEKITLNRAGAKLQLSAAQIHDNLMDMVKCGYAKISGTQVTLLKDLSQKTATPQHAASA